MEQSGNWLPGAALFVVCEVARYCFRYPTWPHLHIAHQELSSERNICRWHFSTCAKVGADK